MLKINGRKILTNVDLLENFDFAALLQNLEEYLRFDDFAFPPGETRALCEVIRDGTQDRLPEESLPGTLDEVLESCLGGERIGWDLTADIYVRENRGALEELLGAVQREEWTPRQQYNRFAVVFLMHYLAQAPMSEAGELVEELWRREDRPPAATLQRQAPREIAVHGGRIPAYPLPADGQLVASDYYVQVYDFPDNSAAPIAIRRFRNVVESYGKTRVLVLQTGGEILFTRELCCGESLAMQMVGDRFLRWTVSMGVSDTHCVRADGVAVSRYTFRDQVLHRYDADVLGGMMQFCVDDQNGFVGVSAEGFLPYTNVEFQGLYEIDDAVASIDLDGDLYMALSADGRIYTNLHAADHWTGLVAVCGLRDGTALGIRPNGRAVSTDLVLEETINRKAGTRKVIDLSAGDGGYFVQFSNGEYLLQSPAHPPAPPVYARALSGGFAFLTDNGEVYWNAEPIASDVRELCVGGKFVVMRTGVDDQVYDTQIKSLYTLPK